LTIIIIIYINTQFTVNIIYKVIIKKKKKKKKTGEMCFLGLHHYIRI